jgi:hypothetical protein
MTLVFLESQKRMTHTINIDGKSLSSVRILRAAIEMYDTVRDIACYETHIFFKLTLYWGLRLKKTISSELRTNETLKFFLPHRRP